MASLSLIQDSFADASDTGVSLADAFRQEMTWLSAVVDARIRSYFASEQVGVHLPVPPPQSRTSRYGELLARLNAGVSERIILALALAPHVSPQLLDVFFLRNQQTDRGFTEFGGLKGIQHAGFIPTGETALFVLAGDDMAARIRAIPLLDAGHELQASGVLQLGAPSQSEPPWSGALSISTAFMRHLINGEEPRPEVGPSFPAQPIRTRLTWDDLVLDPEALAEVQTIAAWARHHRLLLNEWGLGRHLTPGFSALFYGPPGTGKTLTASLLGKQLGVEVYRIDLSQVVSKYIGETEKNLGRVFEEAERRGWILFFDEADALFGKRTATTSSHDRYANQEVSYLLQRVEEHRGIVVLATNLRSNIDEAFARRFQVAVHFATPDVAQRDRIWRTVIGPKVKLADTVNVAALAREHELTGGQIVNVVRHACLVAVQRHEGVVTLPDIARAIRREQRKEGRSA